MSPGAGTSRALGPSRISNRSSCRWWPRRRTDMNRDVPNHDSYYQRACDAWEIYCLERGGLQAPQPTYALSTVDRRRDGNIRVRLRNVNGPLRTYRYKEVRQ